MSLTSRESDPRCRASRAEKFVVLSKNSDATVSSIYARGNVTQPNRAGQMSAQAGRKDEHIVHPRILCTYVFRFGVHSDIRVDARH